MTLFKKHLRKIAFAGGTATLALIGTIAAGFLVSDGVTIQSTPIKTNAEIYIDLNGNGLNNDAGEFVGQYDVYDWNEPFIVSWALPDATSVPAENGAYYLAIRQYAIGQPLFGPAYTEIKGQFAFVEAGNAFTFDALGYGENICFGCPSVVVIVPHTFELVQIQEDFYDYVYTPITVAEEGVPMMLMSEPFVFEQAVREDFGLSAQCQDVGLPGEGATNDFEVDGDACLCGSDGTQQLTSRICDLKESKLVFDGEKCGCR